MYLISFNSYIKFQNNSVKFIESPEGIKEGIQINRYYDDFLKDYNFTSGPKPDNNPWQYSTFKTGKIPKDVYSIWGKIDKGFFISKRFKEFLLDFNIAEHVIFDEIKYFNGIEYKNDLSWIAFFIDYWNFLDFKLSKFILIDKSKSFTKEDGSENHIKNNIIFNNIEEYNQFLSSIKNTNLTLNCRKAHFNINLDFIPIFHISNNTFICSENFKNKIKYEKFKGIEILENSYIV